MRTALLTWVLIAVPAMVAAQSTSAGRPALPSIGLPLPPIGLPLAPIGLPLPPIGLPPASSTPAPDAGAGPVDQPGAGRDGHRRPHRGPAGGHGRAAVVFVAPWHWWGIPSAAFPSTAPLPGMVADAGRVAGSASTASQPPGAPESGTLVLDLAPVPDIQVFVDGYYVGTVDDLDGRLVLAPGSYAIELRATGHDPVAFQVRIAAGQSIAYRGSLTPVEPPAAAPPALPRSTMYLIPGCYLGNVHPREVSLPPGCDLTRLVVREP